MKMKEKVKEFYEKHEEDIKGLAAVACVATGAGMIGYAFGASKYAGEMFITNDWVKTTLRDAQDRYNLMNIYTGGHASGLTPGDLGKLGEKMMLSGAEEGIKYTHFIAIGDGK